MTEQEKQERLIVALHESEQENGRYRRLIAQAEYDLSVALAALRKDMQEGAQRRAEVTEERLDRWVTEFRRIQSR